MTPSKTGKHFFNKGVVIPFAVMTLAVTSIFYFLDKAPWWYSVLSGIIISFFACFGVAFLFSGTMNRLVTRITTSTRRKEIERWQQLLASKGFTITVDKINIDVTHNDRKITAQFAKSGHYFFLHGITKDDSKLWENFPHLKYADEFKDGVLIEAKKKMTDEDVIAFLRNFCS